jgi:hypothetical protein
MNCTSASEIQGLIRVETRDGDSRVKIIGFRPFNARFPVASAIYDYFVHYDIQNKDEMDYGTLESFVYHSLLRQGYDFRIANLWSGGLWKSLTAKHILEAEEV